MICQSKKKEEIEKSLKEETEKYETIFANNKKVMNDIRQAIEIPQNYKAWRLEVSGICKRGSMEDIQKKILGLGIETNMYEVDITRRRRT